MKKSVKILSVVLALVIVLGCFAACGGDKGETKTTLVMATNAAFPPTNMLKAANSLVSTLRLLPQLLKSSV